jgi:hypothetical protein
MVSSVLHESVVVSPQILAGDRAMMRLKPKEQGKLKKPRRYYTALRHKNFPGELIEVPLNAVEGDLKTAHINLGDILKDLDDGIHPGKARQKIKNIKKPESYAPKSRSEGIYRKHIIPFFGELKPREVDKEVCERYLQHRWGLNEDDGLQAMENTWIKESGVLRQLIQSVYPRWELPKLQYEACYKVKLPPLKFEDIKKAGSFAKGDYEILFWTMAYSGIEPMDCADLKPKHFKIKPGWLKKVRCKTRHHKKPQQISVPVISEWKKFLDKIPTPLNDNEPLFPNLDPKALSKYVRLACFERAGVTYKDEKKEIHTYGSKSLRRHLGTILLDLGYTKDWIQQALAHCEDSTETVKYMDIYDSTMEEAFSKIQLRAVGKVLE